MLKPALSDQEMYATLEAIITIISQRVPAGNREYSSFPDQEILTTLRKQGYNRKMSWAFLRACYWYLADHDIMAITPSVNYHLKQKITEDMKTDLCMNIFSQYETFLQANYVWSLITPDPYYAPEKAPDSSPGFLARMLSGGK